jgi:hypothetical protein
MLMLHDFIAAHREQIIARCREKASGRSDSPPVPEKIELGVPVLLEQLVSVLRVGLDPGPEIAMTAIMHGRYLLRAGFPVSEVVYTYGDVCQSITELVVELDGTISAADFRLLNKCLDDAIAGAVSEFGREQGHHTAARKPAYASERDELRNLCTSALLAFEALTSGQVAVAGSTGARLHRYLIELGDHADRLLAKAPLADSELQAQR